MQATNKALKPFIVPAVAGNNPLYGLMFFIFLTRKFHFIFITRFFMDYKVYWRKNGEQDQED